MLITTGAGLFLLVRPFSAGAGVAEAAAVVTAIAVAGRGGLAAVRLDT